MVVLRVMDISLLSTTYHSEHLRTLALAMVQKMAAPTASRWSAVRYLHKSSRKEMRQTAWPIR